MRFWRNFWKDPAHTPPDEYLLDDQFRLVGGLDQYRKQLSSLTCVLSGRAESDEAKQVLQYARKLMETYDDGDHSCDAIEARYLWARNWLPTEESQQLLRMISIDPNHDKYNPDTVHTFEQAAEYLREALICPEFPLSGRRWEHGALSMSLWSMG